MASPPRALKLTRQQIAAFAGNDFDTIRQIERLFNTADTTSSTTTEIEILAQLAAQGPLRAPNPAQQIDTIDFARFPAFVGQEARAGWEPFSGTLSWGMEGNVLQRVGLNSFVRVVNNSGAAIDAGAVLASPSVSVGGIIEVVLFAADGTMPPNECMGLAASGIANGATGYACLLGSVEGLDTSAFAQGDVLYASTTPGAVTTTPAALAVHVGTVAQVSTTEGVIEARVGIAGPVRLAAVAAPAGGGTVDAEARTAIGLLIARLQQSGIIV